MKNSIEKTYLTAAEVCELLHICKTTLHKLNKTGLSDAKREVGGKHLYLRDQLIAFIERQKLGGNEHE